MRKGFTLVELLAVIVILAVLALITVPLIINIVESSRKGAARSSAYGYMEGVNIFYSKEILKGNDFTLNGTFNVGENGYLENNKIEVEGAMAKGGHLTYNNGKVSEGCLTINEYKVSIENDEVTNVEKGSCDGTSESIPTPTVPEAKSFATDSWDTIIANVRAGTTDVYEVGDTKEVTLTSEDEEIAGTYTLRIANKSTPNECLQEDFSQTACGFVVEFEDIITARQMNTKYTNVGGWPDSELYGYLKNDIYNSLPNDLKRVIIDTKVISGHGYDDESNFITTDKLYLLSLHEVYENSSSSEVSTEDTAYDKTRQLDYYEGVTISNSSKAIKEYNDSTEYWWLRGAYSNGTGSFHSVYSVNDGRWGWRKSDFFDGVSPAFRIG